MKKIAMILAAAAIAVSASAQRTVVTANKATDNIYVGINAGVAVPTTNHAWMKDITPNVGIRVGKNFTTVFGVAVEGNAYAWSACDGKGPKMDTKTFIDAINVNLLGTVNLNNLFCGYKGEPQTFEVIALGGFGWGHVFGATGRPNSVTSKVAIDFALNLGKDKAWQVYLEPSLNYGLQNHVTGTYSEPQVNATYKICANNDLKYNINRSNFQLNLGVNYKFGNSNGTHNFAVEQLRDQAEIDALNAKINALQKALNDCENRPAKVVEKVVEKEVVKEIKNSNLQPSVVFGLGKSVVENSQLANVEMIAKYMKNNPESIVKISGYASPEGPAQLNQTLSEKRAEAVKNVLVKKYGIAADRLQTEGLGATDKLFDQVEFNRVALFNDTTK